MVKARELLPHDGNGRPRNGVSRACPIAFRVRRSLRGGRAWREFVEAYGADLLVCVMSVSEGSQIGLDRLRVAQRRRVDALVLVGGDLHDELAQTALVAETPCAFGIFRKRSHLAPFDLPHPMREGTTLIVIDVGTPGLAGIERLTIGMLVGIDALSALLQPAQMHIQGGDGAGPRQ